MDRIEIINKLIKSINGKKYLEIGVEGGLCFPNIQAEYKVGVDPDIHSKATVKETSDSFFEKNTEFFDVVFVDGLHLAEQVEKDVINSLKVLNDGGYIVCHDLLPTQEYMQLRNRMSGLWTGDCWKAWVKLRSERSDLTMYAIDTDWGCGVIQKGSQNTINIDNIPLTYSNLIKHKQEWLNIVSIEEFNTKIGQ